MNKITNIINTMTSELKYVFDKVETNPNSNDLKVFTI